MQRFKIFTYALTMAFCCANSLQAKCADTADTDETTKRVDLPFIHIGVRKHANGQKDVDVRAPFVNVHNPAGPDNAQVKAPFTKVDHTQSTSQQKPVTNKNTVSTTTVKQNTVVDKTNNRTQ
jgi:hypothetical protein